MYVGPQVPVQNKSAKAKLKSHIKMKKSNGKIKKAMAK